ncbi:MAG: hypothetical protein LRZ84_12400 [Desertifilum sp.]|nr:hypothetical protein [Desertifilum sp.]
MTKQREDYEYSISKQLEAWEDFCPVCGQEIYVGDPPGAGSYCTNPQCPECNEDRLENWDDID